MFFFPLLTWWLCLLSFGPLARWPRFWPWALPGGFVGFFFLSLSWVLPPVCCLMVGVLMLSQLVSVAAGFLAERAAVAVLDVVLIP